MISNITQQKKCCTIMIFCINNANINLIYKNEIKLF